MENGDFTEDIPSIQVICKELGISLDEIEEDNTKFLEILSRYLKKRLIKLIYMEDKSNSYMKDFSREVDLYLRIDSRLDKQSTSNDLLLNKLNQLSNLLNSAKSNKSKKQESG